MQYGEPAGEAGRKPPDRLRRQRDLRDQHEPLAAGREHLCEQSEVDLRLAAGRDAMHQEYVALVAAQRNRDPFLCRLLRRLELDITRSRRPTCMPQDPTVPATLDRAPHHGAHPRWQDGANHFVQRHRVVGGHESRELDQERRHQRLGVNQRLDRLQLEHRRHRLQCIHEAGYYPLAEGYPNPVTDLDHAGQIVGNRVIEQATDAADPSLHRHLRHRAQPGVSRGCERHRSHPRSARPPATLAGGELRQPRLTARRW